MYICVFLSTDAWPSNLHFLKLQNPATPHQYKNKTKKRPSSHSSAQPGVKNKKALNKTFLHSEYTLTWNWRVANQILSDVCLVHSQLDLCMIFIPILVSQVISHLSFPWIPHVAPSSNGRPLLGSTLTWWNRLHLKSASAQRYSLANHSWVTYLYQPSTWSVESKTKRRMAKMFLFSFLFFFNFFV